MNSDAVQIKDKAFEVLQGLPGIKTFRKSKSPHILVRELPSLTVTMGSETWRPDGDSNAAEPRFYHEATLEVRITATARRTEDLDDLLDRLGQAALDRLLTSMDFVGESEGFERIVRRTEYPKTREHLVAEHRIDLEVSFRTAWQPNVPDDLTTIHVDYQPADEDEPLLSYDYTLETE